MHAAVTGRDGRVAENDVAIFPIVENWRVETRDSMGFEMPRSALITGSTIALSPNGTRPWKWREGAPVMMICGELMATVSKLRGDPCSYKLRVCNLEVVLFSSVLR